jgi:hypothetical protein
LRTEPEQDEMALADVLLCNNGGPFKQITALNPAAEERRLRVERSNGLPVSTYTNERPILIENWYRRRKAEGDWVA